MKKKWKCATLIGSCGIVAVNSQAYGSHYLDHEDTRQNENHRLQGKSKTQFFFLSFFKNLNSLVVQEFFSHHYIQ